MTDTKNNKTRNVVLNLFQDLLIGLLSKRPYRKVCRCGAFRYLLLSSFRVTTDPGLQLSRMTTTTIQKDKQKTRRVQAAGITKNNYIKYPTAKLIRLAADSVQVKRLANSNTLGLVARAGE